MDMNELKNAATSIRMPDDTLQRIIAHINRDTNYAPTEKRPVRRWSLKASVAVAVLAVVLITAGSATCAYIFKNPTILKDYDDLEDMRSQENAPSGYSVTYPNSSTPHSLDEMVEAYTFKSDGWLSDETIGGSIRSSDNWTTMDVIQAEGDLKSRIIYADNGAVKREYTAEDPCTLQDMISGDFQFDLAGLTADFETVPFANVLYNVTDKKDRYVGAHFAVLYAKENGYFGMEYSHCVEDRNDAHNQFVAEDNYDKAYFYTTPQGVPFLIEAYGDCVWASCTTEHSHISLYGGYLSTDDVEAVLDHITLKDFS